MTAAPRALAALLVLPLALAGCVGTEEPVDLAAGAAAAAAREADAPATDPPAEVTAAPAAVAPAAPDARTSPFSWETTIGPGARACAPGLPGGCVAAPLPAGDPAYRRVEWEGRLRGFSLTATWDAATPATETLRAIVAYGVSCGADCIEVAGVAADVEGASPLVLEASDLPGETFDVAYVRLVQPRPEAPVAYGLDVAQAYLVEGLLAHEVPTAG